MTDLATVAVYSTRSDAEIVRAHPEAGGVKPCAPGVVVDQMFPTQFVGPNTEHRITIRPLRLEPGCIDEQCLLAIRGASQRVTRLAIESSGNAQVQFPTRCWYTCAQLLQRRERYRGHLQI